MSTRTVIDHEIQTVSNVISTGEFKAHVRKIFAQVSDVLVSTLGPFGTTTIIEQMGKLYATKDGWTVLKNITYNDVVSNSVLKLLTNISAQLVTKVGDGSTSSIVAANQILEHFETSDEFREVRPKDFIDAMAKCVADINDKILQYSTKIINPADIYKVAYISTNGDDVISGMIQDIYEQTENPNMDYTLSATNKTYHEIIDGYRADIRYLDGIYADDESGLCTINSPLILMFDHTVTKDDHLDRFISPAIMKAIEMNRRLVVIAPYYDKYILQHIKNVTMNQVRSGQKSAVVFCKSHVVSNFSKLLYSDFVTLTGGTVIDDNMLYDKEYAFDPENHYGAVNRLEVNEKNTFIQGFCNRNEDIYNATVNDARKKYEQKLEQSKELNIVSSELYELKRRLSKLTCRMGIIYVGGNSTLAKESTKDLVDDAVKACESAYRYGYNIGGNLIIPIVIDEIKEAWAENTTEWKILNLLRMAFVEVFTRVFLNKYPEKDGSEFKDIIEKCISEKTCYDLVHNNYSKEVINPCHTDIEILNAATSIVAFLTSSNQYLSLIPQ